MPEPSPSNPGKGRFRWVKRLLAGIAVLALTALGLAWYCGLLDGNLREVSKGKVYRSAQLKPAAFKQTIESRGIKSVVNLRGFRKNEAWYQGELALCEAEKVEHVDINIGLGDLPRPEVLQALVAKLEAGPYPMLLHCRSGADRSALGAAFYMHIVEKKPLDEAAREQLTWRYGHVPVGKAKSIDEFFELYRTTANGQSLKEWLNTAYPKIYAQRTSGAVTED